MNCYGVFDAVTKNEVLEPNGLMAVRGMCNARELKEQNKENNTDIQLVDGNLQIDGSVGFFPPLRQVGHRQLQHPSSPNNARCAGCCNQTTKNSVGHMNVAVNKDNLVSATKPNQSLTTCLTRPKKSNLNVGLSKNQTTTQEKQQYSPCSRSFGKPTRSIPLAKMSVVPKISNDLAECDVDAKELGEQSEEGHEMDSDINVFGETLTDDLLRLWTNSEDIKLIVSAELRVDAVKVTNFDSLSNRMPCLNSLKLNNSNIPQIRMLGTGFMNLKRLWIGSSHVQNLRGIASCAPILEELYASFNSIYEITPLLDLGDTLEVVDLEGNAIQKIDSLLNSLSFLKKVKYLTLDGNPVAMSSNCCSLNTTGCEAESSGTRSIVGFRERVLSVMPNLQYLDDIGVAVNTAATNSSSSSCHLEKKDVFTNNVNHSRQNSTHVDPLNVSLHDEYMFLQHCIRECGFDALDAAVAEETNAVCSRPQSSFSLSLLGARCCSSSSKSLMRSKRLGSLNSMNCVTCVPNRISKDADKSSVSGGNIASSLTSSITGGSVVIGNTVSGRHRLPPLQPLNVSASEIRKKNANGGLSGGDEITTNNCGFGLNDASAPLLTEETGVVMGGLPQEGDVHMSTAANPAASCAEDDWDAPLFDDDDEDDWEAYKQSFMRRVESRRAGVQHWAKYVTGESAVSSKGGDRESQGLSAFSRSTYTRTTSASSDPAALLGLPLRQAVEEDKDDGEKGDEGAWWQELLRSVVQSRMQTARAALDAECPRDGE